MTAVVYVPQDAAALSIGAEGVAAALQRELTARGIEARLARNGSRGMLWLEPLVEVETAEGRIGYGPVTAADVPGLLERLHLAGDADRLLREFSQGMRRKTALAAAFLGNPAVLVLDEALNGLDPPSAATVKAMLRERVDAGATVLLSTHVLSTVQTVADRVVMLAHGRVVADEDVSGLLDGPDPGQQIVGAVRFLPAYGGRLEVGGGIGHACPSDRLPADDSA